MGIKPDKYPLTNIVDFDKINSLIEQSIYQSAGTDLIFVFGTGEQPDKWQYIDSSTAGLAKFNDPFSFYYDVKFIDILKQYRESGYMVFLLYMDSPQGGVVIVNATINWSTDRIELSSMKLPDGFKVIDINDIGISRDGQLMFGRVENTEENSLVESADGGVYL